MSYFKVLDVRVLSRFDSDPDLIIDGLNAGGQVFRNNISATRVALMLSVFNTGRDCYWDEKKHALTTRPLGFETDTPPLTDRGRVTAWDVHVPVTGDITFFFSLLSEYEESKERITSGNAATGWAQLIADDGRAVVTLALVMSSFCYYVPTSLRNTNIIGSTAWEP